MKREIHIINSANKQPTSLFRKSKLHGSDSKDNKPNFQIYSKSG